jgi:hypothetical protein
VWWEYVLRDDGNTEVAEQTFGKLDKFASAVKAMRAAMGRLFIMRMVDIHNTKITADLTRKGMHPYPASHARAMPPARYWECAVFGDSSGI